MRRLLSVLAVCVFSFLGGAFAQTIGGGGFVNTALATIINLVNFTGSRAYSGDSSANNSFMWGDSLTLSGTATNGNSDGQISPFNLYISSDTVATSTFLTGFNFKHIVSAGHSGGRTAIQGYIWVNGTPSTAPTAGYVGLLGINDCAANLTGSTGVYANYLGGCFGGNSNVFTGSAATFLRTLNAHEFDVALVSGSSAADKFGISIVQTGSDAVQGTYDDTAIEISNQSGASGWQAGIEFGGYGHVWPITSTGTIFRATAQVSPSPGTPVALYGIDLSAVSFSAGGAPLVMPLITPATSGTTCKTGSIEWDTGFIYICTATNTWKRAALTSF